MNPQRGIFDQYSSGEPNGYVNPFSFAVEAPPSSPFSAVPLAPQSPFASMPDSVQDRSMPEPGKPAKIPAPRAKPSESPFQVVAENGNHYGYDSPQPSPFAVAPMLRTAAPIAPINAPQPAQSNPFSFPREMAASMPAYGAYAQGPMPQTSIAQGPFPSAGASASQIGQPFYSDESPVFRQLELRAIFGVDREMSGEEILQRSRALPGVIQVARIASQDVIALENLKRTLQALGFGSGNLRLYNGHVPIEFVRDGATILAVQTDGGFAPGIRETMMIVARELDKMGPV